MNRKIVKSTSGNSSPAIAIAIGIGVTMLLLVLLSAGLTSLVLNGQVSEESTYIYVFAIRVVSVLLGCLVTSFMVKEKIIFMIGCTVLGCLLVLLGFGIVMFDMSFQNFGMGLLSVLIGGITAYFIKINPLGNKNRIKHYTR